MCFKYVVLITLVLESACSKFEPGHRLLSDVTFLCKYHFIFFLPFSSASQPLFCSLCCSCRELSAQQSFWQVCRYRAGVLISPQPDQEGNKLQRQKILMFICHIYNHNWANITINYIYITRLASNEIFPPSNKIHREVSRAKVLYIYRGADKSLARPGRKQATATEDFDVHISYL